MILISHRGNINNIDINKENLPENIRECIKFGFDVEIDVWKKDGEWFLGHDSPDYEIDLNFISQNKTSLWCHAKNLEAFESMLQKDIHCFWHQEDDYTLTSKGYIWTYPNKPVCKNSVIVCKSLKETQYYANLDIAGICSDFIGALS